MTPQQIVTAASSLVANAVTRAGDASVVSISGKGRSELHVGFFITDSCFSINTGTRLFVRRSWQH